jgi:hypothetical protein
VAEALGLKAGGAVDITVSPVKKGKFEVILKPISYDKIYP